MNFGNEVDRRLQMTKVFFHILATVLLVLSFAGSSEIKLGSVDILAHGGGTDKCGCYEKKSTGEYHCYTRKQRGGDCRA